MKVRRRIARLASNVLNPFIVSFITLAVISFQSASGPAEALKWLAFSIAFSVLPVFIAVVLLVRHRKLESIFINVRRQRNKIYFLASVCAGLGCLALFYLGAPSVLVATFVAGLLAIIVFMCINLSWKISVHTAFVTASVTVLIVLYGAVGILAAVTLPPVVWSRVELQHHSPAQVAVGALLAALIVVVVFYFFGLVEPVARAV